MKRLLLALLVALLPTQGFGQASVLQGGAWTSGLLPMYSTSGGTSQPVIQQSATAAGGASSIKELSIISRASGTAPYVGSGGGYLGSTLCLYDGPTTGAYHQLCLSPNATGSTGLISYNAYGGATAQGLNVNLNGTTYSFPFSTTGIVGPATTVVSDAVCWNNTTGTLVKTCAGAAPLTIGGSANQVQYNAAGSLGGFTVGGDATLVVATGALTVTKLNGVTATLGGTLTTAGAFTTTGATFTTTFTLTGNTSVTLPTSGTLASLTGTEALTNKTYNGNTWTAGTGTLTLGAAKTATISNTLTLTATDGSTLAIGAGGTLGTAAFTAASAYMLAGVQVSNVLGGDVALNNTGSFFDGPTMAQGSTGTWYASGTVTLKDTAGSAAFFCKLWDGTTVVATAGAASVAINALTTISLSGYLATPAGNLRISCNDSTSTSGAIKFNASGLSKDSSIWAFRVN